MTSRNCLVIRAQGYLLVSLVLLSSLGCLGCQSITRKEVEAAVWSLNLPLPPELCGPKPTTCDATSKSLWCRGFYRVLDGGGLEFISACAPEAAQMKGVWGPHLKEMLDKYLPEEPRKGD